MHYFDSFVVANPPLFLEEYVDLGSNERIQQYDESYCGAYCLYMIYLIDRAFRIKSALNILVNQCIYPGLYNECFCLGCNVNQGRDEVLGTPTCFADVNDNDNVNNKDNVIDNDNDNVNALRSSFANNDNVNDNVNDKDNVNDLRSSFANNDIANDLRSRFLIMIILMIYEVALLIMIMIMLIREPASQVIMTMIMIKIMTMMIKTIIHIYWMKNIKRVNITIIPLIVISLLI